MDTTTHLGGTWTDATIQMGTSANDINSLSTTFAANQDPALIIVYTGPVTYLQITGNGTTCRARSASTCSCRHRSSTTRWPVT